MEAARRTSTSSHAPQRRVYPLQPHTDVCSKFSFPLNRSVVPNRWSPTVPMEQLGQLYMKSSDWKGVQVLQRYCADGVGVGWGLCHEGELGTGNQYNLLTPFMIGGLDRPIRFGCASMSSTWLGTRNHLITMGGGMWGELGIGNPRFSRSVVSNDNNMPVCLGQIDVSAFSDKDRMIDVVAGHSYFTCVSLRGHVYAWGANNYGQCHHELHNACCGFAQKREVPGEKFVEVACANFTVLGRTLSGAIYGWGLSRLLGDEANVKAELEKVNMSLVEVQEDRAVAPVPIRINFFDQKAIVLIRAGPWHAAAVDRTGAVYTWGLGNNGRLGHGNESDAVVPCLVAALQGKSVVDVACGSYHTVFVTATGEAFACGDNQGGQCGVLGEFSVPTPQRMHVTCDRRVVQAACGRHHTILLFETGDAAAYGTGLALGVGCGYGMRLVRCQPILENYTTLWVSAGNSHNFALTIGKNTTMLVLGMPHRGVPPATTAVSLKDGIMSCGVGAGFTAIVSRRGALYTFGFGGWGQLAFDASGTKTSTPDRVPVVNGATRVGYFARTAVTYVAAGFSFALAIVEGERVYAWGNNSFGQCGLGMDPTRYNCIVIPQEVSWLADKIIIQVACGSYFSLALSASGDVYSWGTIECCGLGLQPDPSIVPPHMLMRDVGKESQGIILSPVRVQDLSNIVQIAAGGWHALALNSIGEVYAWGIGTGGRLGLGHTDHVHVPARINCNFFFTRIGCGCYTSYGIDDNATLYLWGINDMMQLGIQGPSKVVTPTRVLDRVRDVALGKYYSVVLTFDNTFHMAGVMESEEGITKSKGFHDTENLPDLIKPDAMARKGFHGLRLFGGLEHVIVLLEQDRIRPSGMRAVTQLLRTQPERIITDFKE